MVQNGQDPLTMPNATNDAAYIRAKTAEKIYKAKLVELAYKKQAGKLVEQESVRREAFTKGRKLRDILLASSKKIAPFVAAESSPEKCETLLDEAFKKIIVKYLEGDLRQDVED
jgi:hypothetical protein